MGLTPAIACAQSAQATRKIHCRIRLSAVALAVAYSTAQADEVPPPSADPVEVVVTGHQLPVQTLMDRKVYTVTSDVQSNFGSLSDILSTIPSVNVDPDGIVSLRGDANVLILIDGKPSAQFSGQSAGETLQSIPAKDIERIEILTTPPAQFKADGAAGVINIIMRKKTSDGLTGSVQGSFGNGGRTVDGAGASYRSGALVVSATAGYRHDLRERVIKSDLTAQAPATGQINDSDSSTHETIFRTVPTVGLSGEYALNDRQSINGSVNWSERLSHRSYTQFEVSDNQSAALSGYSESFNTRHDVLTNSDASLGFTQKLARPEETLAFSLTRSTSQQHQFYEYTDDSFIPAAATVSDNLSLQEDYETTAAGVDYTLPLSKTQTLKLGYAFEQDDYSFRDVGNNVDPLTGAQVADPGVTDDFTFSQQINAAYASYQANSRAWTWLGGLRAELTHTDSRQQTDAFRVSGSYSKLYPSLHINYSLSDNSTLSLGASNRVSRPDPEYLNPYVQREYKPDLGTGNPYLRPQLTQSYELGYGFEGPGLAFDLTGYYRLNQDSMTDLTEYLGNGLTLTTKANLPKDDAAGLEASLNGRITDRLNYSVSSNLFYRRMDAPTLGNSGLQSTTGLNAKLKLDYRPTTRDVAQLTATRTARVLTPQGYVDAVNLMNIGFDHQLMPQLHAIATISDVFDGQRFRRIAISPTFTQQYQRTTRGRVLYLGVSYLFGSKKDKQPNFDYDR